MKHPTVFSVALLVWVFATPSTSRAQAMVNACGAVYQGAGILTQDLVCDPDVSIGHSSAVPVLSANVSFAGVPARLSPHLRVVRLRDRAVGELGRLDDRQLKVGSRPRTSAPARLAGAAAVDAAEKDSRERRLSARPRGMDRRRAYDLRH